MDPEAPSKDLKRVLEAVTALSRARSLEDVMHVVRRAARELTAAEVPMAPTGGNKAMKMVVILFVSTVLPAGLSS